MQGKRWVFCQVIAMAIFGISAENLYNFRDCGSMGGKINSFRIPQCYNFKNKCMLERSRNATVSMNFTPDHILHAVHARPRGIIMNIDLRLPLKRENGCIFAGLKCPLKANEPHEYEVSWWTWDIPRFDTILRWYLDDGFGRNIICAEILATFV